MGCWVASLPCLPNGMVCYIVLDSTTVAWADVQLVQLSMLCSTAHFLVALQPHYAVPKSQLMGEQTSKMVCLLESSKLTALPCCTLDGAPLLL